MSGDFWFGKRVLITGGDGFVATHLANTLLRRGAVVTVTVRHSRPLPTADLLELERGELRPDIEISEMLDIPEGTSKARLAEARGRLREALAGIVAE